MQRPFLLFLFALISGIVAGDALSLPVSGLLFSLFPLPFLLVTGMLRRKFHLTLLSVMAILFLQGSLNITLLDRPSLRSEGRGQEIHRERSTLEGVICDSPQYLPGKTRIILQATRILRNGRYFPASERILLTVKGRQDLKYGDFIRCETRLGRPANFNNPGGFDYEKRLRRETISFTGFIADGSRLVVIREGQGNALKGAIERFRDRIRRIIAENAPFPEQAVLQAMVIGDQKEIPPVLTEKFNKTGTSHILAISGFNVGMIALWTVVALRQIFRTSEYLMLRFNIVKLSLLAAFPPVVLYALVAGAGMSVLRAAIMALIVMASVLLNRRQDMVNTLAAAAVLILMVSPAALFDVSFQLSFAAVASIVWINPHLYPFDRETESLPESRSKTVWIEKVKRHSILFLITTVSVTLGTLPIIAFYFNRLSLTVLPANMVLVPILGLMALPMSMMVIAVSPFSDVLAGFLIHCSSWLVNLSLILVDFFAGLPGAAFYVCTPSLWQVAAFYSILFFAVQLTGACRQTPSPEVKRKRWMYAFLLTLSITVLIGGTLFHHHRNRTSRELTVTAIDVHQGNATLVRFPGGKTLLLDGGGLPGDDFDIGRSVVAPFLWHEGIRKIDVVALSHPHADHLGGLLFILENFPVQEVWTSGEAADNEMYRRVLDILSRRGIRRRILSGEKTVLKIGEVGIQLFNPFPGNSSGQNLNEKSLVMRMIFGNVSLMMPGDISAEEESRLIEKNRDLRSDVLFVPHHGSRMSSSMPFLKKVCPKIAVLSCGPDNFFGFPHRETLERYQAVGARIWRTDRQGAITIQSDGHGIGVEGFRKDPGEDFSLERIFQIAPRHSSHGRT